MNKLLVTIFLFTSFSFAQNLNKDISHFFEGIDAAFMLYDFENAKQPMIVHNPRKMQS